MKVHEIDDTVYVLLDEKGEFVITMAHIQEDNAIQNKEKVKKLFPEKEVQVSKMVASDLPRDFDIYEFLVNNEVIEE